MPIVYHVVNEATGEVIAVLDSFDLAQELAARLTEETHLTYVVEIRTSGDRLLPDGQGRP